VPGEAFWKSDRNFARLRSTSPHVLTLSGPLQAAEYRAFRLKAAMVANRAPNRMRESFVRGGAVKRNFGR